jgi:hypothetical protein
MYTQYTLPKWVHIPKWVHPKWVPIPKWVHYTQMGYQTINLK